MIPIGSIQVNKQIITGESTILNTSESPIMAHTRIFNIDHFADHTSGREGSGTKMRSPQKRPPPPQRPPLRKDRRPLAPWGPLDRASPPNRRC
jgi:hypothetical protein